MKRKRVLFLCTHNSARSQMAEGLLRVLAGDEMDVFSAGTEATRVHPLAIEVMKEIGIDISKHRSKILDEFVEQDFDYVITVCDRATRDARYFQEMWNAFRGALTTLRWPRALAISS